MVFNCQLGNKKFEGPNPHMRLPNLFTLRKKFLDWTVQPQAGACAWFLVKLDLTNCRPSLVLPEAVWGTFRIQGVQGVRDLRTLPFGWRFSPVVCQEVVADILSKILRQLPLPAGYSDWDEVDFDHYRDDLLFVEEDREWLECCGPLLAKYLRIEGFVVSQKSVLSPVSLSEWLGKIIDLRELNIFNFQFLKTMLFAALLQVYGRVIQAKLLMRILGLIGWCVAPATGHLPFLSGIYMLLAYRRTDYVRITYNIWRSLVTTTCFAISDFRVPRILSSSWMTVKWLAVDTAEVQLGCGIGWESLMVLQVLFSTVRRGSKTNSCGTIWHLDPD